MNAIDITDLDKSFGTLTVLDGVDLQIAAGTVFALLGPNGAGKTTLINIATTLLAPDGGRVRVGGYDVVSEPEAVRQLISVTGQQAAVDEVLTASENLVLMGRLQGLSASAARRRAADLAEQLAFTESADRRVRTLSGGTRRRLDLALCLVRPSSVIFLDEPTTGLDTRSRQALWAIIDELTGSGVTIFLTTQYLEEADRLASRVAVLNAGRVVAVGDPRELKARIGSEVLEVRDADRLLLAERPVDGTLASVRAALVDLERTLDPGTAVSLRRPTLDDVFLSVTAGGAR